MVTLDFSSNTTTTHNNASECTMMLSSNHDHAISPLDILQWLDNHDEDQDPYEEQEVQDDDDHRHHNDDIEMTHYEGFERSLEN